MKVGTFAFLLLIFAGVATPSADPAFFRYERTVSVGAPEQQNFFVLDPDIWSHARPDLADLRLYNGNTQVPYVLTAEGSGRASGERPAKILNLGQVRGEVEFDLDMSGLSEYDRVTLQLSAKDFVARASIEGRQALADHKGTELGTSTLYDFSRENLGSNTVLRFPASTFPFLHVRVGPGILPKDVQGASIAYLQEAKATWVAAGSCTPLKPEGRTTTASCGVYPGVPLGRILFTVPSEIVNFQRRVTIVDEKGKTVASGSISRVRMKRGMSMVASEELAVSVWGIADSRTLKIAVDNGDDQPIAISSVVPQMWERRIYFEPHGQSNLTLYYGDPKLEPATYDYARFFREEPNGTQAQLSAETLNAAYKGRPDDRPWSERHKSVLWVAMVLAVVVLAALAIRGMLTPTSAQQ